MTGERFDDVAAAVAAKVHRRVLPLLAAGWFIAYLDRFNVGFAALQMNADLGLSAAVFGFGAGIFFIGYSLFEIPSNVILARVGPRVWLARIMITWGLISAAMVFAQGPWSFYLLRFLLGVAEAGCFPGMAYYLARWLSPRDRAAALATLATMSIETTVRCLDRVRPRYAVFHSSLAASVDVLRRQVPSVRRWVCLDAPAEEAHSLAAIATGDAPYDAAWIDASGNRDRPVYYWPTSGTTGEPKVVVDDVVSFDGTMMLTRARQTAGGIRPVSLAVAPLSHAAGAHSVRRSSKSLGSICSRPFDRTAVLVFPRQSRLHMLLSRSRGVGRPARFVSIGGRPMVDSHNHERA